MHQAGRRSVTGYSQAGFSTSKKKVMQEKKLLKIFVRRIEEEKGRDFLPIPISL